MSGSPTNADLCPDSIHATHVVLALDWEISNNNNIIMLYYRLAEHINKYMSVVQYIVSTLSTKVGIQLLTMSVATMRRAHTATVSNENEFVRSTLHLKPVQL